MKNLVTRHLTLGALALAAAFAASSPVFADDAAPTAPPAQAEPAKGGKAGHGPLGGLLDDLNLTDAQKAQVKDIMAAQKTKREAIRNDTTLAAKDKREKQKALREDTITQIRAILTPEQQAKLDAKVAEQQAERKNKEKPAK